MKMSKSPVVSLDVSPAQKKLKQARLPFKILTDVSPKPETPKTRKRKLSAQGNEISSKVGKLSKENGIKDELITISDDDSKGSVADADQEKLPNPFVKLVDSAIKKKLQKSKTPKKRKSRKSGPTKKKSSGQNNEEAMELSESQDEGDIVSESKIEAEETASLNEEDSAQSSVVTTDKDNEKSSENEDGQSTSKTPDEPETIQDVTVISDLDEENSTPSEEKMEVSETVEEIPEEKCDNKLTPKRNMRSRVSNDAKKSSLDDSVSDLKLDESVCSNPSTPKQKRKSVVNADESLNDSMKQLTPKQLQRKQEAAKKREEREKEKLEREKKKLQEKEEREKQKKEKEDQKRKEREEKEEAKKKEREEKEEAKKKEKEEKERQKELEKKMKEEKEEQKKKEKEEKEEQRKKEKEAKEEEKRKKQEALELEKQEQELKKKKAAEAFVNFFVPKQKADKDQVTIVSRNDVLSSFTIKADMRLAPTVRADFTDERKECLDNCIGSQKSNRDNLYLCRLKNGIDKPGTMGKTWPLSDREDDVMIIEDELPLAGVGEELTCETATREKLRPKLLSFHEDRRPPYWGTWRARSRHVTARRPFGHDEKLEYEVDSEAEWEDEAEGESVGSCAGSDVEPDDDYELDNDVFVPHGYLSDEEATLDEEKGDEGLALSPEAQKSRLKHLEEEFEKELKKPTEKLKPRLYGPIWVTNDGGKPENCMEPLWNYFGKLTMIMDDPTPFLQPAPETADTEKKKSKKKKVATDGETQSPSSEKKKKTENKDTKKQKSDSKKNTPEVKKNQMGINSFLTKLKSQ